MIAQRRVAGARETSRFLAANRLISPTGHPDSTNTGYKNHPDYPGYLTPGPGTVVTGTTYTFRDFSGCDVLVANVTFIGCRFRSNSIDGWNVLVEFTGAGTATFSYCTFCPEPSVVRNPPKQAWPCGGAGSDEAGESLAWQIGGQQGYQYGIRNMDGAIAVDHCDMWGWANAIDLHVSDGAVITDTWIHDAAHEDWGDPEVYHQDGIGHLDGGGIENCTIENCTIATIGNTNAIAFQVSSQPYANISVDGCYVTGFGHCVDMCHNSTGNNNLTFTNNTFGTDIRWVFGPLYDDYSSQFAGATNLWQGNRLRIRPGTSPGAGTNPAWTATQSGYFVLPDWTYDTVDFE